MHDRNVRRRNPQIPRFPIDCCNCNCFEELNLASNNVSRSFFRQSISCCNPPVMVSKLQTLFGISIRWIIVSTVWTIFVLFLIPPYGGKRLGWIAIGMSGFPHTVKFLTDLDSAWRKLWSTEQRIGRSYIIKSQTPGYICLRQMVAVKSNENCNRINLFDSCAFWCE